MSTELRDAKIRVVLDLETAEQTATSVEEKTRRARADEERQERRERLRDRARRPAGRAGGVAGAVAAARGARGRISRAVATLVGIGALVELLGPSIAAFVAELLPEELKKLGLDEKVRDAVNDITEMIISDRLSEVAAGVGAVEGARDLARARILAGQPPTAETFLEDIKAEFLRRRSEKQAEQARNRLTRGFIGEALGKGISDLWR